MLEPLSNRGCNLDLFCEYLCFNRRPHFLKFAPIVLYSGTMICNNGIASILKIPMADHCTGIRGIYYSKVYDHGSL
jgi:hypothetical protein